MGEYAFSSLGSIPTVLGSTLNVQSTLVSNPGIFLPTPEKLAIDASEFMNAIYEDMSQINELISIKKQ